VYCVEKNTLTHTTKLDAHTRALAKRSRGSGVYHQERRSYEGPSEASNGSLGDFPPGPKKEEGKKEANRIRGKHRADRVPQETSMSIPGSETREEQGLAYNI
jgi:hypothetical protein